MMTRVLVLSHTSKRSGGAESALFDLVQTLRTKSVEVVMMFSDPSGGDERDRYGALGVPTIQFDCIWTVPDFPRAMFELCTGVDWDGVVAQLRPFGFTHVLSNTIVQIHGAILAAKLEVPHILYAHEYIQDQPFDLHPSGIGGRAYLRLMSELSDEVWACSKYVARQFNDCKVVYPFFHPIESKQVRTFDPTKAVNVVCIGTKSVRKNIAFFLIFAKAVGLLGFPVHFKWIGGDDPRGLAVLESHLSRRVPLTGPIRIEFVPRTDSPYDHVGENPIVLIASHSEPFGLTAIEAMERGIPVMSSRCGGPEELLPPEQLFDVDNIHEAVECLKRVVSNYNAISSAPFRHDEGRVDFTCGYRPKSLDFLDRFRAIRLHDRTPEDIVRLIPSASLEMLRAEHERPGSLVLDELRRFGGTPFCYSDRMDAFYRDGVSMAIELADTMHDRNKEYMVSFVLSALLFRDRTKILSVGDGLANDSIRLSRAGFEMHYLDFDEGKMTQIAKRNAQGEERVRFVSNEFANENPFEVVMCFEVLEHVSDPDVLIRSLAQKTCAGGLLFVSECFVGVTDQWATHLYSNERFVGMLPAMMDPWFELLDVHRAIPGKPFMFRRTSVPFDADILPTMRRWFMNASTYGPIQNALDWKTNSLITF